MWYFNGMKDQDREKPGPKETRLKLDESDWQKAVQKALKKKPPTDQGDKADTADKKTS